MLISGRCSNYKANAVEGKKALRCGSVLIVGSGHRIVQGKVVKIVPTEVCTESPAHALIILGPPSDNLAGAVKQLTVLVTLKNYVGGQ